MKNVTKHLKKGILMVTMFATLLSFANEGSFYIIKNDARRTSLTLKDVKQGNLLSILDNNGIVLYKEQIQKTGIYTKGFDLTALPDGSYIFELDKDVEIKSIPFTVTSSTVEFEKDLEKSIFKPVTKIEDSRVLVSQLSLSEKPLSIEIYYANKGEFNLVHSETIEGTKHIKRVYRLNGLETGKFKMVYTTEGRTFTKNIN